MIGFTGHVDLGRGIRTALSQIVARGARRRPSPSVKMGAAAHTARVPNQGAAIASNTIQNTAVLLLRAAAQASLAILSGARRRRCLRPGRLESLSTREGRVTAGEGGHCPPPMASSSATVRIRLELDEYDAGQAGPRVTVSSAVPVERTDIPAKAVDQPRHHCPRHAPRLPRCPACSVVRRPSLGIDGGQREFAWPSLVSVRR